MQNSFFQAICRVGIFMICAQALLHFRPQETYEKYLKLLVSVMVLIQLFLPVGGFLLGGDTQAAEALEEFRQEMEQSLREAEENAAAAEAILERMTLEEVRSRVEEERRAAEETEAEENTAQTGVEDVRENTAEKEAEAVEEKPEDNIQQNQNIVEKVKIGVEVCTE